ncbi:oxaloacetate decarboxylase [Microvirga aerilata]|uniref:isocitrate lyase/PEP mutase family protein n=1 Tax=Microvirga aerilata TaxID=670292 RepID=UPI0036378F8C
MTKAKELRALLQEGRIIQAPGAPDPLTARLIEKAGFPAIYMTGFGATAVRLGLPDIGLLTQTEMTTHARDMARAVSIPIIADADTGYGGPANITRTVEEYIQAGVAAIHLEDQKLPKRCGQRAGVRVISAEENVRRLRCAIEARKGSDMLLIARTDAIRSEGIEGAIHRARLYQDKGLTSFSSTGSRRLPRLRQSLEVLPDLRSSALSMATRRRPLPQPNCRIWASALYSTRSRLCSRRFGRSTTHSVLLSATGRRETDSVTWSPTRNSARLRVLLTMKRWTTSLGGQNVELPHAFEDGDAVEKASADQ